VDTVPEDRPHLIGNTEALPLRDACVDTVVRPGGLEYIRVPHVALAQMYRVLRPAGHPVLSVPFVHRMDGPADLWRFSEHELREVLAAAGFEVVVLRAPGYALTAVAHLVLSALVQRPSRMSPGRLVWSRFRSSSLHDSSACSSA
jgi:SAM-dependent methyltransferase